MIKVNFDKYGKIRNLDFGDEVIFKGNNRVNQIFVAFDDVAYNPNHYMTYSALINENDYEGNLTDLATAKTTIDGVEGYTFYLFSNLTAKAGELKLSVRLVDRTSERVLVSGIIPLVIEDTAISTYASVNITKTQYEALLTAFDKLSQSIDATNFKTINGESIYGEGDIVVLTGDVMVDYVGQQISDVNDSLWNLSQRISDVETENAELNAIIEKQDKKIKQLELASEGNILSTITESDSAYEVGVGVDTLPFATIDKIGGMTYKSNNLCNQATTQPLSNGYFNTSQGAFGHVEKGKQYTFSLKYESSVNTSKSIGLRAMSNSDGTGTNNGNLSTLQLTKGQRTSVTFTASYSGYIGFNGSGFDTNDKFVDITLNNSSNDLGYQPYFEGLRDSKVTEIISEGYSNNAKLKVNDTIRFIRFTDLNYASNNVQLLQAKGKETDGVYSIILNGGNKRIGVFKKYDFNYNDTYLLMTSTTSVYDLVETFGEELIITSLTNATAVNSVLVNAYKLIQKIAIPTAIQNLDGYGIGVDSTYYNYVDFESKKFVKMIGSYTFTGSEGFGQANTNTSGVYRYFTEVLRNIAIGQSAGNVKGAILMLDLNTATADETYLCKDGVCIDSNGRLYFFKSDIQSASAMANYLKGKTIFFALATPVAEGLSHIIDGEILTEVESGGTLTFENEYKQDVPFTWTFQEKL